MSNIDIAQIDKNFAAEEVKYEGIKMRHVTESPFKIYGLYRPYEDGDFKRMPHNIAENVNTNVKSLYMHTSGGRIRFRTDSTRILLRSILPKITKFNHMPKTGVSCFDLYLDGEYYEVFKHGMLSGLTPDEDKPENVYDSNITLKDKKMRDILINFPLYNRVDDVFIGLDEDAVIEASPEYSITKPIVFYGSSITQGGCASHPGNCYANMLSRQFDADMINLGFSSGAKGEPIMAEYLANLEMSVLVYDYDHNAGSAEHLWNTHENMFKIIREKQPNLPIIMITAADRYFGTIPERKEAIRATYDHAVAAGDKNVYFIDGDDIYAPVGRGYCTVDYAHPNDLGFYMMAQSVGKVLKEIFAKQ